MRFHFTILAFALFYTYVVSYSINVDDLPAFFDDDDDDEVSRPELETFMERFGMDYGYNGTLDTILQTDLRHNHDAVYLDYTGAGMYRDSQIRECEKQLVNHLYGNAHSRSPSSIKTENEVESIREKVLRFFNADPEEYTVVFTSGATGALHTIGESFPWSEKSKFYYLAESHNSVVGIREYAIRFGGGFRSVDEEEVISLGEKGVDGNGNPQMNHHSSSNPEQTTDESSQETKHDHSSPSENQATFSLFAFPAEDNFAGVKYPLQWIETIHSHGFDDSKWFILLDAAAFVPTNRLNLSEIKPDFVTLSFYKLFGFPTGIGALLLHNSTLPHLRKLYWGGGTVSFASEKDHLNLFHDRPCSRFEDGTINFLSILCLKSGFDTLEELGIDAIHRHVDALTQFLYERLTLIRHSNGMPVVEVYGKHEMKDTTMQGGIIAFNLLRSDGSHIGYYDVQTDSAKKNIHVRTGCHCNPGACRKYLRQPDGLYQTLLWMASCM
ncbi:hypothetical protein WA538_003841 [Blastocystis sp. DL]